MLNMFRVPKKHVLSPQHMFLGEINMFLIHKHVLWSIEHVLWPQKMVDGHRTCSVAIEYVYGQKTWSMATEPVLRPYNMLDGHRTYLMAIEKFFRFDVFLRPIVHAKKVWLHFTLDKIWDEGSKKRRPQENMGGFGGAGPHVQLLIMTGEWKK